MVYLQCALSDAHDLIDYANYAFVWRCCALGAEMDNGKSRARGLSGRAPIVNSDTRGAAGNDAILATHPAFEPLLGDCEPSSGVGRCVGSRCRTLPTRDREASGREAAFRGLGVCDLGVGFASPPCGSLGGAAHVTFDWRCL